MNSYRSWKILALLMASALIIGVCSLAALADEGDEEYVIGGPLAGIELPLYPSQHGAPPGYPGSIPELYEEARRENPETTKFTPDGQYPQMYLYPGSVEHWRDHWFRYTPSRSLFDAQSQIENWIAPNLPGAGPEHLEEYAEPVYWVARHGVGSADVKTERTNPPVPVVRCGIDSPVLTLNTGELDIGVYAVRIIAAVEDAEILAGVRPEDDVPFNKPLYLKMTVNDGLNGERNSYRMSVGYLDEFYSIAEFYFHATEKRDYRIELKVDHGSEVELLVHNISLDDVLAGSVRRPIKSRRTMSPAPVPTPEGWRSRYSRDERLARDREIWRAFPRVNSQPYATPFFSKPHSFGGGHPGLNDKMANDIIAEHGEWEPGEGDVFIINRKLGLEYTIDDFNAQRPLPDPYPYKDDGAGLFSVDMETDYPRWDFRGRIWSPIAWEVQRRMAPPPAERERLFSLESYMDNGDLDNAHDVAIRLVRMAYDYPAIDFSNGLTTAARRHTTYRVIVFRFRRRRTNSMLQTYSDLRDVYDQLFDYISESEELAKSVGRFVPWVETPDDVIKLLDTHLVQMEAKRILRYQMYEDGRQPAEIAKVAAVLGTEGADVTNPWMEWLFSRAYVYPYPISGIQDIMITYSKRDGSLYAPRGVRTYADDQGAMDIARSLSDYINAGGSEEYDLSDPARYPKPLARPYSQIAAVIGGWQFPRIAGWGQPGGEISTTFSSMVESAESGWRWSGDSKFAFILKHAVGRTSETDEEWATIEEAAAQVDRAPWMSNRSRILMPVAGVLETGQHHDDYRFRRAAHVRAGMRANQLTPDALDLQIFAHGLPATVSWGRNSPFGLNLVAVDDALNDGYSWISAISDAEGARYMRAQLNHTGNADHYSRQIALIDVDEGEGSQPLPVAQQIPGAELPKGVTTANSYVFDVVRSSGGEMQTYQFHANISEEFDWNAEDVRQALDDPMLEGFDQQPVRNMDFTYESEQKYAGVSPDILRATWKLRRELEGEAPDGSRRRFPASEQQMLGSNYDPESPNKYTRLHLFDVAGAQTRRGEIIHATTSGYQSQVTHVMVTRTGENLQSAFAAIIEPFAGEPFVEDTRLLDIAGNENDALKAVAVEVRLNQRPGEPGGRVDVCFADGRPDNIRQIGDMRMVGEFAFFSADEQGFRQAALTGGTFLEAGGVRIEAAQRERAGRVVSVDYPNRTFVIDSSWPACERDAVFEIGLPGYMTTYTATHIAPHADGTAVTVSEGADYYSSEIVEIDAEAGTVKCVLDFPHPVTLGVDRNWIASNEDMTAFWRAEVSGNGDFRLEPIEIDGVVTPLSMEAFGNSRRLRLWEYGPTDMVRKSTFIGLRRVEPGVFELEADVDVEVTLPGRTVHNITAEQLAANGGSVQLRVRH